MRQLPEPSRGRRVCMNRRYHLENNATRGTKEIINRTLIELL